MAYAESALRFDGMTLSFEQRNDIDVVSRRLCAFAKPWGLPVKEPGAALVMFNQLNETLPPRLRLSDSRVSRLQMHFYCMAKRTLLKQLHADWRKIRQPKPRGFVFPDMSAILPEFAAHKELAAKVVSGAIDISQSSLHEIVDLVQAYVAERIPYFREKLRTVLARVADQRSVELERRH